MQKVCIYALDNLFHSQGLILNLDTVHNVKFRDCLVDQSCAWFPVWTASGCIFHGNGQIAFLWVATSGDLGLKGISKRTVVVVSF